jgi:hypothetical protein
MVALRIQSQVRRGVEGDQRQYEIWEYIPGGTHKKSIKTYSDLFAPLKGESRSFFEGFCIP